MLRVIQLARRFCVMYLVFFIQPYYYQQDLVVYSLAVHAKTVKFIGFYK